MDKDNDYNENCELHVADGKQYETSELNQEKKPSHVHLDKKKTVEGDENGHLLRHEKEPEGLESVHKYASRIKSFLGWVPNEEEQGNGKEDVDDNKATKVECGFLGDSVIREKDYESLEGEEKNNTVLRSTECEQVTDVNFDPLSKADHLNNCNLINNCPKSEVGNSNNKDMNPEVGGVNAISSSQNNFPGKNVKQPTSDSTSPENKSESAIDQSDRTTYEMEQIEQPDLDGSTSFGTVSEDTTKENKASDTDMETVFITDEAEKEEKNGSVDSKTLSEPIICTTNVEKTKTTENGSCGEGLRDTDKSEDNTHLYENVPEMNDMKKPYMDEIRRLSIDIVKDVIESARNSVHEMFANKSERETITENEMANHEDDCNTYVRNGCKISETQNIESEQNLTHKCIEDEKTLQKMHNDFSVSKGNEKVTKDSHDHKECTIDEEMICGFGNYRPRWIQKYATPRTFLFFFSLVGIINGAYYSYVVSIISTLEKRYAFKTKVSGTILLADEITPLILGIIVGYVGGRTHRPRMVTLGMLSSAACSFVSGLPYLIYGSAKHLTLQSVGNVTGLEVCVSEVRSHHCDSDDRPPTMAVVGIFLLASFLKGIATLSYYVIGISYMDDNIKKKNTPLYLAITLALRLLGPLVGFLMSSAFLKMYENPFDDPGYGPDDPRWVGAWWMGFFLQGVLLLIFTLPIALFPKRLPGQKKGEKLSSENKESLRETLRGLVAALKRLGKNPIFILMIINTTLEIFGQFGHSIMLPKYVENQFRLSASDASLFSGAASIFCVMVSTVLGGFLIWKFRPKIKVLLAGMVASEIIMCLGLLILMIPRCQPVEMLHFGMNDNGLILDSVCNHNCDCSTTSFSPFCGQDGKTTYFSPCHAGCTQDIATEMSPIKQMVFGNCSCVSEVNLPEPNPAKVTEGFCPDENCWSKTLVYLIILFVLQTACSTVTVLHTLILLRSVIPGDKSIALGTFETFICLFGLIPFPVFYGALVDSACLVWEESCGETGNCWFYDMEKYNYLLHGASAFFCFLSTICVLAMYFLSSRIRDLYVEDEEENEYINNIKLDTVSGSATKL